MDDYQIAFNRILLHRWTIIAKLSAHGMCPSEELRGSFGLVLIHIQAGYAFNVIYERDQKISVVSIPKVACKSFAGIWNFALSQEGI